MPNQRIIFFLTGLLRRWWVVLLPMIVAAPIAILIWKAAPKQYEAKSTILLTSANRGGDGGGAGHPRNASEQVAVLEAWLKSDGIISELLPQILEGEVPTDSLKLGIVTNALRRSLTLQLVGAAVLEVRLEGEEAQGLGRKLEIIIARLLEGLLNPEAGILNASQLIAARRGEAMMEAEAALNRAIVAAGIENPEQVKSRLQTLHALKRSRVAGPTGLPRGAGKPVSTGSAGAPSADSAAAASQVQQLEEVRISISADPAVVRTLEGLFDIFEEARMSYQDVRERVNSASASYVGVFDAPERLTVIGRPQDPIVGKSSGMKLAVAVMMIAALSGLALGALMVLLDPRLRVNADFEAVSSVPVLARLPKLHPVR